MAEFEFDRGELKGPVIRLLIVFAVASILVWLSSEFEASRQAQLETARAELNSVRSDYRMALQAGDIIKSSHLRYKDLLQRSFIGTEPRLLWIESLRNSGTRHRLYNVHYSLGRQQSVTLENFDNNEHYQLYASPMHLRLELAHEADLVRFFSALSKEQPAIYQLRGCDLTPVFDAKGVALNLANVSADCELLWFTVSPLSEETAEDYEDMS